ncbi:hypothetical protein [Paenibacillus ehimensis]|uniref:hypothetical protein n=1 Tax=Paenibacillus ehimensis TaxID=79264 RepID=UPI0013E3619C|nr:hypothetical protein [Paenibacillus ehimensis]
MDEIKEMLQAIIQRQDAIHDKLDALSARLEKCNATFTESFKQAIDTTTEISRKISV